MHVTVHAVNIEARDTIGRCTGFNEEGEEVTFACDQRMARDIGEAIERATDDAELPVCEPADWQILAVVPA